MYRISQANPCLQSLKMGKNWRKMVRFKEEGGRIRSDDNVDRLYRFFAGIIGFARFWSGNHAIMMVVTNIELTAGCEVQLEDQYCSIFRPELPVFARFWPIAAGVMQPFLRKLMSLAGITPDAQKGFTATQLHRPTEQIYRLFFAD